MQMQPQQNTMEIPNKINAAVQKHQPYQGRKFKRKCLEVCTSNVNIIFKSSLREDDT